MGTFDEQKKQLEEYCDKYYYPKEIDGRTFTLEDNKLENFEHYGYNIVDGKLVINEIQAESIRWLFRTINEYSINPPKVLVEAAKVSAEEQGEILSYEEAKSRVAFVDIMECVCNEFNERLNESQDTIGADGNKIVETITGNRIYAGQKQYHKAVWNRKIKGISEEYIVDIGEHEPIISEDEFRKVNELIFQKKFGNKVKTIEL